MGFETRYTVLAVRRVLEAGQPDQFFLHATSGKNLIVPAEIPKLSSFGQTTIMVVHFDTPVTKPEGAKLMMAMPDFKGTELKGFLKQFAIDNGAIEAKPAKAAPAPVAAPVAAPVKVPKAVAKPAKAPAKVKAAKPAKAIPAPAPVPVAPVGNPEQEAAAAGNLNKIRNLLQNNMKDLPVPAATAA